MKDASNMRMSNISSTALSTLGMSHHVLRGYLQIARVDHWVKNVFVLPGIVVALSLDHKQLTFGILIPILIGLLSTCLVASSNYVINELIDASEDSQHPTKF